MLVRLPRLRSAASFESFISREFAFLLNNWILLACALFVFFATMWPTLSEAFTHDRITLGPPFFNKWMIPLGLTLLFLAGAAPLLAYRRTTRDRLISQSPCVGAMGCGGRAACSRAHRVLTSTIHDNCRRGLADQLRVHRSLIAAWRKSSGAQACESADGGSHAPPHRVIFASGASTAVRVPSRSR